MTAAVFALSGQGLPGSPARCRPSEPTDLRQPRACPPHRQPAQAPRPAETCCPAARKKGFQRAVDEPLAKNRQRPCQ